MRHSKCEFLVLCRCHAGQRAVQLSTFRKLWKQLVPYIVRTKPMTDLCWECQQNNEAVYRSANLPDDVKSQKVQQQENHLAVVQQERSLYNSMIDSARRVVADRHITGLSRCPPNSQPITMHYCFDYAQQVHYPSSPLQPGPVYFLTPRKCGIFGVCCPAVPQQVNYLVDEGMCVGKGSNAVISYLHHFFENYGLGETSVDMHCDNCSGQNKNKFMLWYLAWRVLSKLHSSVSVNFMISGHTKFAPDWCFGLLKQKFRRTQVCTLSDLCNVVSESTVKGINIPQLVGTEDGKVIVSTYDWQSFLQPYFKPLPGLKKLQHFRFSAESPGMVYYRTKPDDPERTFQLLQSPEAFPQAGELQASNPPGLPLERQWYLYNKIREFVRPDAQDVTCPLPQDQLPSKLPVLVSPAAVAKSKETSKGKNVAPHCSATLATKEPPHKRGLLEKSKDKTSQTSQSGPGKTRTRQVKRPKKYD